MYQGEFRSWQGNKVGKQQMKNEGEGGGSGMEKNDAIIAL